MHAGGQIDLSLFKTGFKTPDGQSAILRFTGHYQKLFFFLHIKITKTNVEGNSNYIITSMI